MAPVTVPLRVMALEIGEVKRHEGVCDASAAVFVERGKTLFLVANDEDQHETVLRLYDAAGEGPAVAESRLSTAALQPDEEEPEIDLEGSAWLGDRIFWIGSHSRSKKGKKRPSRHRLFATRYKDGKAEVTGQPYTSLVKDLAPLLNVELDPKRPPKDGGLSIEGLSAARRDGELLIGLRSPLAGDCAVLVSLRNAAAIVDQGKPAKFGPTMLLDLDGRGIRSIDWWPERECYLLLAGPSGDGGGDYELLRWSGRGGEAPEAIEGLPFELIDGGAPEALLIERASETVYIMFDEGNRAVDGVKCKDAAVRSFRSFGVRGI